MSIFDWNGNQRNGQSAQWWREMGGYNPVQYMLVYVLVILTGLGVVGGAIAAIVAYSDAHARF